VPCCVVTAQRGKSRYPVKAVKFNGKLPQKNCKLAEASRLLSSSETEFEYYEIGQRSFLESREFDKVLKAIESGARSGYYEYFTQGATIVPRQLWFVEPVIHPKLGIDPLKPRLRTSQRAIERAKEEYVDVFIEGEVESRFLYRVITGSEILPFGTTRAPIAILPIEPNGGNYRMIESEEAQRKGFTGLKNWLKKADTIWQEKRKEKANRLTIYQRLNYSRGLTSQSSKKRYRILYNTSGTYLVSCVVRSKPLMLKVGSSEIHVSGVIADHKTYRFDTDNYDEGLYIAALLNSPIIDSLIKPMQSRGLWGERDIHKKVLELPLPKFNPRNKMHLEMVELAKEAQKKATKIIPELETRYSGIGKIRQLAKSELSEEILKIDKIVRKLIIQNGKLPNSIADYVKN
jgi:hypothetical protein